MLPNPVIVSTLLCTTLVDSIYEKYAVWLSTHCPAPLSPHTTYSPALVTTLTRGTGRTGPERLKLTAKGHTSLLPRSGIQLALNLVQEFMLKSTFRSNGGKDLAVRQNRRNSPFRGEEASLLCVEEWRTSDLLLVLLLHVQNMMADAALCEMSAVLKVSDEGLG
jgi:hypothetical protein